jgi:hypothetical protein
MKRCEYGSKGCIIFLFFVGEPNMVDCYIILSWKGLPVVHTLTYCPHS